MDGKEIQALRHSLSENAEAFGARFSRSKRTVEDWEQGRRTPDPLILKMLEALKNAQSKKNNKKRKAQDS